MKHLTWKIGAPISKFQFGFKTIDRKGVLAAERALLVPGGIQDYQLNGFPCPFRFPDAKIFKILRVYSPNQQQPWNPADRKSVGKGKSVSGRVDLGGRRHLKK